MKFLIPSHLYRTVAAVLALGLGGYLSACSYKNGYEPTPCNMPLTVSYKTDVLPILTNNCYRCHNAANYVLKTQGYFNMESFTQMQFYCNPVNGKGGVSPMVGNIRHDAGFNNMPYDGGKLSDCDIAIIKAWVDAGALNN